MRFRFLDLCDVKDRGQVVLGMTNNLPPLFHYISAPFLHLTGNLWYSPAFANLLLAVLSALVMYFIGKAIKDTSTGLLFSFIFAIFPPAILVARFISPEQTELFFVLLISYFFIRLEVLEKKDHRNMFIFLYFISLAVGAFSKQQTAFILFPIFIFGLFKHRLRIFKKEIYYISAFAILPYFFFLLAHPEMLAAVMIYFIQPTGQLTISYKTFQVLLIYVSQALPFFLIMIYYLLRYFYSLYKRKRNHRFSDISLFMLIMFLLYTLFIIKTLPNYFHLLTLPIIYYSAKGIYSMNARWLRYATLLVLLLYCILGFFLLISGFSIVTYDRCEEAELGLGQNFILELAGAPPVDNYGFFNGEEGKKLKDIVSGEKYILIGGNTGQDLKYNMNSRLYYAGVMNTDRYADINYVLLVYPIDKTYTGAPAWDYGYLSFLKDHSKKVFSTSRAWRHIELWRITDHSLDGLAVPDFRERSRTSLKLD